MFTKVSRINVKILTTLLILFTLTGVVVSGLNMVNLRNIHISSFNQRVLATNNLIAALIDSGDVQHYVELLRSQDEGFKQRQYAFLLDREEYYRLLEVHGSAEDLDAVTARLDSFRTQMDDLKTDRYWNTVGNLKKLKAASGLTYVYIFTDTGVTDSNGEMLYTYIFDAEDNGGYQNPAADGLGTVGYSVDDVAEIYQTKRQLETVFYYNAEPFGELYYAYAPILDDEGRVLALLGTDMGLQEINRDISRSAALFNTVFVAFAVVSVLVIYLFLSRSVTKPLGALIATARRIAQGDVYAAIPEDTLQQQSELGVLARAVADMSGVYQSMIINRVLLDSNPFVCVIFDTEMNIIDCNPKALETYNAATRDDLNARYRDMLAKAIPEYQPNGNKSRTLGDKVQTVMKEGYCEFDTYLQLEGSLIPFATIMKLVEYRSRPAIVIYQYDLTAQKEIQRKLEYRGRLLQAVSDVSDLLLAANTENFEMTLHNAFAIMGRTVGADRVYIWKNHTDDEGKLFMTQLYEWSPNTEPQQGNELTVNISYDDVMPSWQTTLFKNRCLNNLVKNLNREEQDQLFPQGIVSFLLAPIFISGKFWGFIGFDDCHNERIFSKTEENILRTLGYMSMVVNDTIQNEIAMKLIADREEALTTARSKNNFLANMSHEIRTPMNAILGMTELILHENTGDTVLGYATDIQNACKGLLSLINDILDFSKIESGKLEIVPSRYQIASLLMDVISIIKMRADVKRLPFMVTIDAGLPSELMGDEMRVKQVLINMLSNAVKFTNEGHIALTVGGETIGGKFYLKCTVADTGIGIQQEDLDKLFESFRQIDTRKNRNIEGTGLGLSISKQLVEMMGGSITVDSKYGVGSTFTASILQEIANETPVAAVKTAVKPSALVYENRSLYLQSLTYALDNLGCPYRICANQSDLHGMLGEFACDYIFVSSLHADKTKDLAAGVQPKAAVVALCGDGLPAEPGTLCLTTPLHSLQLANFFNADYNGEHTPPTPAAAAVKLFAPNAKVLVVDDNMVNLRVAAGLLKTYGIQADTASSGPAAIEMVQKTAYDLVFMDHMMPVMDGIDTTVAIRQLEGASFQTLPIIALTANAISGAREMFAAEGLDDYLSKPIEMSKLGALLEKWIPGEKQSMGTVENPAMTTETPTDEPVISGLDVQKGIGYAGDSLENYLDILAAYQADGAKRLQVILELWQGGDVKILTTYAHALKSASANIGADGLSRRAAELEQAGRNGDTDYISQNIKPFADELSILLTNIRCYLAGLSKEQTASKQTADYGFLRKTLQKITASFEAVDMEATEALTAELMTYRWRDDIAGLLDQLKSCLDFFDYDGIGHVLDAMAHIIGDDV